MHNASAEVMDPGSFSCTCARTRSLHSWSGLHPGPELSDASAGVESHRMITNALFHTIFRGHERNDPCLQLYFHNFPEESRVKNNVLGSELVTCRLTFACQQWIVEQHEQSLLGRRLNSSKVTLNNTKSMRSSDQTLTTPRWDERKRRQ